MKKVCVGMLLCFGLMVFPVHKSHAFFWVIAKAALIKAIKAVDLAIQRQQNKVIWAQNAQKTLENYMSKFKLDEITDWSKKQKEQYQKYFDELQQVKLYITYYQRIKDILKKQARLVQQYQLGWGLLKNDKHFTPKEVDYMGKVYSGILDETIKNIDQVMLVVNSFRTEMTDAQRLKIINQAGDKVDENYTDLVRFNQGNAILSLQRAKDQFDVDQVKLMYGLK